MMWASYMSRSFRATFPARASEWALAVMLVSWSAILLSIPTIFEKQAYYEAMSQLMAQHSWGIFCLVVGGGRLTVLFINGLWSRSPHLRALASFLSGLVWLQVAIGLLQSGIVNTGLAIYPVLFALDTFNTVRAMGDAGVSDRPAVVVPENEHNT